MGAVENAEIFVAQTLVRADSRKNGAGNVGSFLPLILQLTVTDFASVSLIRPQGLALSVPIVGNDPVGGGEDGVGGAVVLLQTDDLRILEL